LRNNRLRAPPEPLDEVAQGRHRFLPRQRPAALDERRQTESSGSKAKAMTGGCAKSMIDRAIDATGL
jgi:hypothetical protein